MQVLNTKALFQSTYLKSFIFNCCLSNLLFLFQKIPKMNHFYHIFNTVALLLSILACFQIQETNGACEGSVTFYWKETSAGRSETMRNWGVLETDKKITKSTSQLEKVIDVNNTYAFALEGDCCWELFGEKFFKGDGIKLKQKLPSGFAGVPGFPKFKAVSVKKSQPKGKPKKC